ncbi:MAG: TrmH family RNA methyltransferase [Anaerolineales bacterium]
MITSVRNPKVQEVRALQQRAKKRRKAGAFVVEGVRLAEEALNAEWTVRQIFYTEDLSERGRQVMRELKKRGAAEESVSSSVMEAMSDTESPQGLLLEVGEREIAIPRQLDLVLILDKVSDPGNLGTLLRSAVAAGCQAALLTEGSADPFSPKVLRSGMGAQFTLPIQEMAWSEIAEFCKQHRLNVFVTELSEGQPYNEADLTHSLAFVIGGEARGVSEEAKRMDARPIHIPMAGEIESLNAAIAGSILLFEALRQRRAAEKHL